MRKPLFMNVMSAPLKTILMALLCVAPLVLSSGQAQQSDSGTTLLRIICARAEQGDAQAQKDLADAYYLGDLGLAKNEAEAAKWFRKAADQNHAMAQSYLGG